MTAKRFILLAVLTAPVQALSQSSPDTTAAIAPQKPQLDFSGTLFANYQYHIDDERAGSANKFDLERAYLTFRMPAGEKVSVRITADVFQQTASGSDAFYRGWTLRAKYAYLQYNFLNGREWRVNARVGLLHTIFIDYDEQFWPRWIAPSPTDRAGYFSSADAGIAATISLPKKLGDVYATVVNGPGYTSREVDRFKDYAVRISLNPFASRLVSPLEYLAVTGWVYKGSTASKFSDGGQGQAGEIGSALDRDRWGIHLGALHPRANLGIEYASRSEEGETGNNTIDSPRSVIDSTGTLFSVYAVVRPFKAGRSTSHPLSLIARYDRVGVNDSPIARYRVIIGGLGWDISKVASMSLDIQDTKPINRDAVEPSRIWFAHFVARF
jgi:hypothetical protein